jgi:hypothetical protein
MDNRRLPSAQEIPTVDEAGVPGLHVSTYSGCGEPRALPRPSSLSSTPHSLRRWLIRSCASGSRTSGRRCSRAGSRRHRRSLPSTRPRSRNGGRS